MLSFDFFEFINNIYYFPNFTYPPAEHGRCRWTLIENNRIVKMNNSSKKQQLDSNDNVNEKY